MNFGELEVEIAHEMATRLGMTTGTNVFIGEAPQDIVEYINVIAVPSPPSEKYINTEYVVIDFWSRSPHTDRSKALLRNVFELYNRRYAYQTNSWYIYFSHALGSIVDTDRDAEGGKLFRLSIQFTCRNITEIS